MGFCPESYRFSEKGITMTKPITPVTEELDRIAEDYQQYLDFIPEQYCQMCEKSGDWIVPNDEPESKEQYPWFCTNCEDASKVINLRSILITKIDEELHQKDTECKRRIKEAKQAIKIRIKQIINTNTIFLLPSHTKKYKNFYKKKLYKTTNINITKKLLNSLTQPKKKS